MKKIINTIIVLLISVIAIAQTPNKISYRAKITDKDSYILADSAVSLRISILNNEDTELFSEEHYVRTDAHGIVNLVIGEGDNQLGSLELCNWLDGINKIKVELDNTGGTNFVISGTQELSSVPLAYNTVRTSKETMSYNDIKDMPQFIQTLSISGDTLIISDGNSVAISNITGWKSDGTNIFSTKKYVGIGVSDNIQNSGGVLNLGGAVLFNQATPTTPTPGLLFYDNTGDGGFYYYNNNGDKKSLNDSVLVKEDIFWEKVGDVNVASSNCIVPYSVSAGEGLDFSSAIPDNYSTFLIADDNIRVLIDDTSEDPEFNNDWQILINDDVSSFFAIRDVTNNSIPFKIVDSDFDSRVEINKYFVNIGAYSLDTGLNVGGNVKADYFVGNGEGIYGIIGGESGDFENITDVEISADTDSNGVGVINFLIGDNSVMLLDLNNVALGNITSNSFLNVDGEFKTDNLNTNLLKTGARYSENIVDDFSDNVTEEINVTDKYILSMQPTIGDVVITGFNSGLTGQVIILINKGTSNVVVQHNGAGSQSFLLPGSANLTISPNSSAKFLFDGTNWMCIQKY